MPHGGKRGLALGASVPSARVSPTRASGTPIRMELGYAMSCEERRPLDLVRDAQAAEEAGMRFALISDHFHPWTDAQGQSHFVW